MVELLLAKENVGGSSPPARLKRRSILGLVLFIYKTSPKNVFKDLNFDSRPFFFTGTGDQTKTKDLGGV